jgi:hypothetical protein
MSPGLLKSKPRHVLACLVKVFLCKAEEMWSVHNGTNRAWWEKFEAGIEKFC